MHSNEEHWLCEGISPSAVAQVPHFRTSLPVQLCLLHHLLHLSICKRVAIVLVEHFEDFHIVNFVLRFQEPNRGLLLLCQTIHARGS